MLSRAALAQLVEQLLRKEKVDSSIPSSGTKNLLNQYVRKVAKGDFFVCETIPLGALLRGQVRQLVDYREQSEAHPPDA